VLVACASTTKSYLDGVQKDFANGKYETTDKSLSDQSNLDLLINGSALFHADEYKASDAEFEEFNKRNLHETSTSISREAAGLLFGNGVNSYKPYMMDSLFVSYYQIWDLLALGDWSNARVVINQSYNRQQNMSYEYKKMIENNKKKISENAEINEFINKNASDWLAFSDIMNPALMYLSGIYFLNDGDFDNAITYLKRANGMMPENTFIKQDLDFAQKRTKPKNTSWQFIETGFAPRLREKNDGIFLPKIGMVYFSFSEPYLNDNYTTPANSQMLANVDAMFMTEYREYQTNEILRAFTSAASKTALQATMYNSHSDSATLLGVLSSVYTVASSNTDVRTWATLPKYIYVSRKTDLNTEKNNLIYTRIINGKITDEKQIPLR
jgi:hypothetical protein